MKTCNSCRQAKPPTDFHARKASGDGLCHTCKECAKARARASHNSNREKRNARRKSSYAENHTRELASRRAWREANRERSRQIVREWVCANPGAKAASDKRWREENKERINADKKAYRAARRGEYNAYFNAYRAKVAQRTAAWADLAEIKRIYGEAAALRAQGVDVHVDHEVPLHGRRVSGLHVHNNLRIIPALDNLKKNNTFKVD